MAWKRAGAKWLHVGAIRNLQPIRIPDLIDAPQRDGKAYRRILWRLRFYRLWNEESNLQIFHGSIRANLERPVLLPNSSAPVFGQYRARRRRIHGIHGLTGNVVSITYTLQK